MKEVLFIASTDRHINGFHSPYLLLFKQNGWKTNVITCENKEKIAYCDKKYTVHQFRNPFNVKSYRAIKEVKEIIDNNHFDIIHCHTPMASVITRIAAKKARKNGTRVIYTAHGFHFYKGSPIINWLIYYPVEWYLSKFTDTLITINEEDYNLAKNKLGKRCHDIQYVPGVGINPNKFKFKIAKYKKDELRSSLGLDNSDFLLIFPARLNREKNQAFLIKCMSTIIKSHQDIHLLLPGKDEMNGKCQKIANRLSVNKNVHFLGRRNDIPELLKISNLAVSSSKREGLPINVIESQLCGLPIVAYKCRGCSEIINNKTGKIIRNKNDFINAIEYYYERRHRIVNKDIDRYFIKNILKKMKKIYRV